MDGTKAHIFTFKGPVDFFSQVLFNSLEHLQACSHIRLPGYFRNKHPASTSKVTLILDQQAVQYLSLNRVGHC